MYFKQISNVNDRSRKLITKPVIHALPSVKKATSYEDCFEYGVILEGNVLSESVYKFPYDCNGLLQS